MTPQRVNLITLSVADLDRSIAYYKALGWTQAGEPNDSIAFYKLYGLFLSLYKRDMLESDLGQPVAPSTGAMALSINHPSEKDVDTAHQAALNAGATEIHKPTKAHWGGYSAYIADPDGHLWENAYNPFWTLDNNGQVTGEP